MRRRLPIALVLLGGLVVAACGTRLEDEAFAPTSQVVSVGDVPADGSFAPGSDSDTGSGTDTFGGDSSGDASVPGSPSSDGGGSDPAAPGATTAGGGQAGPTPGGASTAPGAPAASGPNQASDVGVTESVIRIGNITAENGVLGDTFAPAVRGLRAWAQHTNANGGIGGRKVELFTCDDREDRARTLECARRLVEQDKVFALVATNTRAFGGAAQYLSDKGVPVIGLPITNSFYRYPQFFTVYGTGYARDGKTVGVDGNIVSSSGQYRWFKQNLKVTKAAVFNYDISESSQAGDTMVKGLEAEGFSVSRYSVSFAAPSFDQAVADMQRQGIELVYDAMDDGANRKLCDAMARRGYKPKAKVSTVVVMGASLGSNYNDTCRNVIFIPNESQPFTSNAPEIAEFRKAYAQYQPGLPLHQWALEAWAMGNIAQDAITSMGPAPTRAGFIKFLNTMEPNTGGGIMVGTDFRRGSYDYSSPTAKDCFSIARWQDDKGGWVSASNPFPFCYPDAKTFAAKAQEQGN